MKERRSLGIPPAQIFHTRSGEVSNFVATGWTAQGLLVVAQDAKLLEFDGRSWTQIAAGGPRGALSVLVSRATNRIYVSGFDDVGYFEPDAHGNHHYVSIQAELQGKFPVLRSMKTQQGDTIYFHAPEGIFGYSPRGLKLWNTVGTCGGIWTMGNRLFVGDGGAGFMELTPDGLRPAPGGGEKFTDKTEAISGAAPLADGSLALITRTQLFRYDGREFTKVAHPPFLGRPTLSGSGRWLTIQHSNLIDIFGSDLRYHGTIQGMDRLLRLSPRRVIPEAPSGLWIGSPSGLLRLDMDSPASVYGEEVNLKLPVADTIILGTELVAFGDDGAVTARLIDAGIADTFKRRETGRGFGANIVGNDVFYIRDSAIGDDFYLRSLHSSLEMQVPRQARSVHASPLRPDSVIYLLKTGRGNTVSRLEKREGEWRVEDDWLKLDRTTFSVDEDNDGALWLSIGSGRIARAHPPFRPEDVDYFDQTHGLPDSWVRALRIGRHIRFETHHGLYEFSLEERRFRPSEVNSHLPPEFGQSPRRIRSLGGRALWFGAESTAAVVTVDDDARWVSHRIISLKDQDLGSCAYQEPGIAWLSASAGLIRVDTRASPPPPPAFSTSIRSIVSLGEERQVVYGGAGEGPGEEIALPYEQNTLELRVAANTYERPENTRFQFRLGGDDARWSEWSGRSTLVLPSVPPGKHRVEVRSQSADGRLGAPASFTVSVVRPWFHTWWAYLGYGVSGLGALAASAWIASVRHRRRAHELESAVDARTRVISRQAAEIQQQNARLLETNEELEAAIEQRQEAEREREATHRELLVASRQAGMAEIASSVLHNVGNALNSISTSAAQAREAARRIDAGRIARAAELVGASAGQIAGEKSLQLRSYLEQVAQVVHQEQTVVRDELARVREGIDHVGAVIAAQQRFASAPNVRETVTVRELVESAIRLSLASFQRHRVLVETDLAELPPVTTDKHKVLQILVNLLANARQACDLDPKPEKRVAVRALAVDGAQVRLVVEDNGVGIRPDDLARLFQAGFTTRADGHGLGLHSSSLAARQLGGTLTAHSEGPGQGARFELTIPIEAPAD